MSRLLGKTIKNAEARQSEGKDDVPYLDLEFTDGSKVTIFSTYGGYTGQSVDEYPVYFLIKDGKFIDEIERKREDS